MAHRRAGITNLDRWEARLERYLQLARGGWARQRGARAGARFGLGRRVQLLYPTCFEAGDDVTILEDSFLHCLSARGVKLGNFTCLDRNLWLHCGGTPDRLDHGYVVIGEHSYIGCNAVLGAGGGISIGNGVLIGQNVNMHAENHNFGDPNRRIRDQGVTYEPIVIEDDVWIGSKATVLGGVTVGRGAVIAAGAVVTRSIPPMSVAAGVPARVMRFRDRPS